MVNDNKGVIGGTVSSELVKNEYGFYEFTLKNVRKSGTADYVDCWLREELDLKIGDKIEVHGYVGSTSGKRLHNYVVVQSISDYIDEVNNFTIEGFVTTEVLYSDQIKNNKKISKFLMANNHHNSARYIPVYMFGLNAEWIKECKKGTHFKGSGRLQSRNFIKDDEERCVLEFCVKKLVIFNEKQCFE